MKADLARRRKTGPGMEQLTIVVTDHAGKTDTLRVDLVYVPKFHITNPLGFMMDVDGKWHRPFQMVDGKWEPFVDPNVQWKLRDPTDDEIMALGEVHQKLKPFRHRDLVGQCTFTEIEDLEHKVHIFLTDPPRVDPITKMVHFRIKAYDTDTGEPLWVDDGNWLFDDPPSKLDGLEDPVGRIKKELAMRVRQEQR